MEDDYGNNKWIDVETKSKVIGDSNNKILVSVMSEYNPHHDIISVNRGTSFYPSVKIDYTECPLLVGYREFDYPITRFGITSKFQPYLLFCKQRSCPKCSGHKSFVESNNHKRLYDRGNPDSWFFVTFTGHGMDSPFRHSSLREQVYFMKSYFNNFIKYTKRKWNPLDIDKSHNIKNNYEQDFKSQLLHKARLCEDYASDMRIKRGKQFTDKYESSVLFPLLTKGCYSMVNCYDILVDYYETLRDEYRGEALHLNINPVDSVHYTGNDISYVAAIEFTLNRNNTKINSLCTDECNHGHWNTHIHAHIYAPQWRYAMAKMKLPNQPLWKRNRKGNYIPPKAFRDEIKRVSELSGFGSRLDICRLNIHDENSKDSYNYIYKNYIFKSTNHYDDAWYRRTVNHALKGQPQWFTGGAFFNKMAEYKPSRRKQRELSLANALDEIIPDLEFTETFTELSHLKTRLRILAEPKVNVMRNHFNKNLFRVN